MGIGRRVRCGRLTGVETVDTNYPLTSNSIAVSI